MFPSVDYYVLRTLEKLEEWDYPEIDIEESERNVFLGSGNAFNTALLFIKVFDGIALNVGNYKEFFRKERKGYKVHIISASGGKDSVKMARFLKRKGIKIVLITNNPEAPSKKFASKVFVFPCFKEPPTYNVSTYSSMIYFLFKENVKKIKKFIQRIKIPNLKKYKYILFVSKDELYPIARMASRKVAETLQGIGSHAECISDAAHGFFIQPNKWRLVFCIDCDVEERKKFRLKIKSYLGSLLSSYYIIGKNQTASDSKNIAKNYALLIKKQKWKIRGIV